MSLSESMALDDTLDPAKVLELVTHAKSLQAQLRQAQARLAETEPALVKLQERAAFFEARVKELEARL